MLRNLSLDNIMYAAVDAGMESERLVNKGYIAIGLSDSYTFHLWLVDTIAGFENTSWYSKKSFDTVNLCRYLRVMMLRNYGTPAGKEHLEWLLSIYKKDSEDYPNLYTYSEE